MSKALDIPLGSKFGELTVLHAENMKHGLWNCLCSCGASKVVQGKDLRKFHVTSCGCKSTSTQFKLQDLVGRRFGRLVVVKWDRKDNNNNSYWDCLCDCGKHKIVRAAHLRRGDVRSCGCFRKGETSAFTLAAKARGLIPESDDRGKHYQPGVKFWRRQVIERDGWTCQKCGNTQSGPKKDRVPVVAHHIVGWNVDSSRRYDVENGITLCLDCHRKFHLEFGYGDNTEEQLKKYMTN